MSASYPDYRLRRVEQPAEESAEIVPVVEDTRREFLKRGLGVASALALMDGVAPGQQKAASARPPGAVFAHAEAVTGLEFTPDSERLVSCSLDGTVKIWELRKPRATEPVVLDGHRGPVNDLAISGDGKRLATASDDQTVGLWSLPEGRPSETFSFSRRRGDRQSALSVEFDDEFVVAGLSNGFLRFRRESGGANLRPRYVGGPPNDIEAAHGGGLYVATDDPEVATQGGARSPLKDLEHEGEILSVHQSADGEWLASSGADGAVIVRSIQKQNSPLRLAGHPSAINDVAFSPDGTLLACGGDGDPEDEENGSPAVHLWSLPAGERTESLPVPFDVMTVAISSDGRVLAAGDAQGAILLWDLASRKLIGFLYDPNANTEGGSVYHVVNEATRFTMVYTLPCGSPVPAGAVCTCNCVPGTYRPPQVVKVEQEEVEVETRLVPKPAEEPQVVVTETKTETKTETTTEAERIRRRLEQRKARRERPVGTSKRLTYRQRRALQLRAQARRAAAARAQRAIVYRLYLERIRRYSRGSSGGGSRTICTCNTISY